LTIEKFGLLLSIEYVGVQFTSAGIHRVDSRRPSTRCCQVCNVSAVSSKCTLSLHQ